MYTEVQNSLVMFWCAWSWGALVVVEFPSFIGETSFLIYCAVDLKFTMKSHIIEEKKSVALLCLVTLYLCCLLSFSFREIIQIVFTTFQYHVTGLCWWVSWRWLSFHLSITASLNPGNCTFKAHIVQQPSLWGYHDTSQVCPWRVSLGVQSTWYHSVMSGFRRFDLFPRCLHIIS